MEKDFKTIREHVPNDQLTVLYFFCTKYIFYETFFFDALIYVKFGEKCRLVDSVTRHIWVVQMRGR